MRLSAAVACTKVSNTVATCGSATYNIGGLVSGTGQPYLTWTDTVNGYEYFMEVNPLPTTLPSTTCTLNSASYVAAQYILASKQCFGLGSTPVATFALSTSTPQVLTVTYATGQSSKTNILNLVCAASLSVNPITTSKNALNGTQYTWTVNTPLACGGGPGPGPAPGPSPFVAPKKSSSNGVGGIVVLCLFFGGLFLYFVAGAIYLKVAKQATGTELIINKEFWFSLPGFVKEGCRFCWAKIRRNEYQKL